MLVGRRQISILRTVHGGCWFDCAGRNGLYRACMRLEARRLLARDPQNRWRFTSTPAGDELVERHDDALDAAIAARTQHQDYPRGGSGTAREASGGQPLPGDGDIGDLKRSADHAAPYGVQPAPHMHSTARRAA